MEQNRLAGRCTIVREKDAPENVSDQNTRCEAVLKGKTIDFDLAPSLMDGGLRFEAQLEGGRLTGVWMLDGFVGSGPLGRIQAVKSGS